MEDARFPLNFGLLLCLVLILNVAYFAFTIDPANVSVSLDESGPVETFQLAYLAGATVLFLAAGLMSSKASRMFCVGMSVLCIVFFLRELEIAKSGPVTGYLNSKVFRLHEAIIVAGLAALYLTFYWRYVGQIARFVLSRAAWPFYVAAVLLLMGAYFDYRHGTVPMQIREEISESASYLSLMAIAAALCYQYSRGTTRKRLVDTLILSVIVVIFVSACLLTDFVQS
ncbi:MAG: hypothetical protein ACRECY_05360 [Phyllobacterium sp.]